MGEGRGEVLAQVCPGCGGGDSVREVERQTQATEFVSASLKARIVGYCSTCRFFIRYASERAINRGQRRFGRCRLRIEAITVNAACDRYEPPARFPARFPA